MKIDWLDVTVGKPSRRFTILVQTELGVKLSPLDIANDETLKNINKTISLPGIDPPEKRYKVPRTRTLRHKATRAEQDQMVAEYENEILTPAEIIKKYDISPGQLYNILPKHHIDCIYKPKQKKLLK
jgi:hypothetical protein